MIFQGLRAPERHVFREVRERRPGRGRDELGAGDGRVPADELDDVGRR